MVGRDVVADLEDEPTGEVFFRRFADGDRLDVRSALDRRCPPLPRGRRAISMRLSLMRKCAGVWISGAFAERARIRHHACERGDGGGLR